MKLKRFPNYIQHEIKDCGPTCLQIIAKYYGRIIPIQTLRELTQTTRIGSSLKGLTYAAEKIGLRTLVLRLSVKQIEEEVPMPCIVHWRGNHFVVLYKIKKGTFYVSDPAFGLITYTREEFLKGLTTQTKQEDKLGFVMMIDKTPAFFEKEYQEEKIGDFAFIFKYVSKYQKFFNQLLISIFATSLLTLLFPFLAQAVVDIGIQNQDLDFIYLILFSQLMLFIGKSSLEIIKAWINLHVTKRINISILADFIRKLMRLPIAFFDTRQVGDLFQRFTDQSRIDEFIANTSISTILSLVNILVFGFVLGYYNQNILFIFLGFSALYTTWILIFMRQRRVLDYKQFSENAQNQGKVFELFTGMQEIKINNAELPKRWEWERIQARLFKISIMNLSLEQKQSVGAELINELKNIIISFYSAKLVIQGDITLGMMLSISYMIGQLNLPLLQMLQVFKSFQDAKIGIARLREIHEMKDEDEHISQGLPVDFSKDICFENVSFRYSKISDKFLFEGLDLTIPANKTTAIVGYSGSGKTTLLKLILKFYSVEKGMVSFGNTDLNNILAEDLRRNCGVVMQEGVTFPNTVAHNVMLGSDVIDYNRLNYALQVANIQDFVTSLPQGVHTEIGKNGIGMSTGQKQRLLIARAVYKNPRLLLFDEATSALDAENEKIIMNNLFEFFHEKTVVIVAHRLSTVKNADKIIVLHQGKIVEEGNHQELTTKKGAYYHLVKNQLELGN